MLKRKVDSLNMESYLLRIFIIALSITWLQGCSSHNMDITYKPTSQPTTSKTIGKIETVNVTDSRGTPTNWLGAIRGGYGNPLKKLYTDGNTSDVVATAFEEALQARGLIAPKNISKFRVNVTLEKFDTSYFFNKEAHAHFSVALVHTPTQQTVFSQTYRTDNEEGGVGAGIFGNVDALAEFANKTLNQNIDKALDDPQFIAALESMPTNLSSQQAPSDRLREIKQLRKNGLITQEEFEEKREIIVDSL